MAADRIDHFAPRPLVDRCARPSAQAWRLGVIDLSFHHASAAVVAWLLRRHQVTVQVLAAPHEAMFRQLRDNTVDMVVSAWLPGSHQVYVEPMEDRLMALTSLYEPYALWGVPDYVPTEAVSSVSDLLKTEVSHRMIKLIQGIGPGAGISRFSREIMARYELGKSGYEFRNGTLQDCVDAFESAVETAQWVVVPLWQPQFLHQRHRIRALKEPLGLLQGCDQATLMVRRDAVERLPPKALAALRRMHLGNAAVTELDEMIGRQRREPSEAVSEWMAQRPELLRHWERT